MGAHPRSIAKVKKMGLMCLVAQCFIGFVVSPEKVLSLAERAHCPKRTGVSETSPVFLLDTLTPRKSSFPYGFSFVLISLIAKKKPDYFDFLTIVLPFPFSKQRTLVSAEICSHSQSCLL